MQITTTYRVLVCWCILSAAAICADRPNIVLILADDLGYGDSQCYGIEKCKIETPNIDALARSGVRFTDAHANSSVCVPTRVAIMTGRYPWRFGHGIPGGPWGFLGPRFGSQTFTLGKMFGRAGYRTGYVGKWHLGTSMKTTDGGVQGLTNVDYTRPLLEGPVQHGFDASFILPGSLDMYPYAFIRNNAWVGRINAQKGWSAFNRVGPAEENFEDHEVVERFYEEAESFIAAQSDDTPFFLFLALTAPHTPTSPGEAWIGKSKLGVYGDFVMQVDHSIERVLAALRAKEMDKNTVILFASDHGAAPYAGNILKATPGQVELLKEQGHHCSGELRGYKFSIYEGGLRVPLIVNWPKGAAQGMTCDALVGLNDMMASFAELAGESLADNEAPDSISFAGLLKNPNGTGQRRNLVMQSIRNCFAIRDGDWKLCLCPGSGAVGNFGNRPDPNSVWKRALAKFDQQTSTDKSQQKPTITASDLTRPPFVQLFNLSRDLHEDSNLATQHADRVAAMTQLLKRQIEFGRSTPGPRLTNDRPVKLFNTRDRRLPGFVRNRLR